MVRSTRINMSHSDSRPVSSETPFLIDLMDVLLSV